MAINITSNNVDRRSIVSTLLSDKPQRLKSDKIIANFRISRGEWDAFKTFCRRKYGKDASDVLREYIQHELGERCILNN